MSDGNEHIDDVETGEGELSEVEERARAQGWNPDYDGPNKKSAEQFLKDGEEINAILKERMDKILEDQKYLKKQLSKKDETLMKFVKHSEEQKKRAVEKAIADVKEQRRAAIEEGDAEAVDGFDTEIENLKQQAKESEEFISTATQVDEVPNEPSLEFQEWAEQNPWYESNEEMTQEALVIGNELVKSGVYKSEKALLNAVTRRMKTLFPEEFSGNQEEDGEDEPRARKMEVEPGRKGGTRKKSSKKKGYNDLPPEAKQACDEFVAEIPGYTVEKYLESYEW